MVLELHYFKRLHLSYLHSLVHLHVVNEIRAIIHSLKRNKMAPHREEALVYEQLSILVSSLVNVGCRWR
ncbi:hypothetical protein MtrunA17_Chr8g0361531 [Medicago truncatula]|uniref:Uncharacterized protein n=1 Tax=Medicago truncatula TaxID=3880 RepID=A0A396GIQ2_MEDTR|nr:hypothetical protein MtrunA17_Chr8g0361531 [Medicago truncatula]